MGNIRVAIFVSVLVLAWSSRESWVIFSALIATIILFFILGAFHRRITREMNRARRATAVYSRGLARLEDRWAGTGDTRDEFKDPLHPDAEDLDILGQGSLFQLLSTARTRMGKQRLANWLLAPASAPEIEERHSAIIELKQKIALREDLLVAGESERIRAHPEELVRWAEERSGMRDGRWWALLLAVLSMAA